MNLRPVTNCWPPRTTSTVAICAPNAERTLKRFWLPHNCCSWPPPASSTASPRCSSTAAADTSSWSPAQHSITRCTRPAPSLDCWPCSTVTRHILPIGKHIAALVLAAATSVAAAGPFERCLLDNLPGTGSDAAARMIRQACREETIPPRCRSLSAPSLEQWLPAATKENASATRAELKGFWESRYRATWEREFDACLAECEHNRRPGKPEADCLPPP